MLKNINKLLVLVLLLVFGCDDFLDDTNVDSNTPDQVSVSMRLTYAENQVFEFLGDEQNDRFGSLFAQYLSNGDGRENVDTYDLEGNGGDGFYLYHGALKDLDQMYDEIEATGISHAHYIGVGKIIEATALGALTDAMGDIPYSQALQGSDQIYPEYDTQEAIYQTIQTLLSDAITELSKSESVALKGDFLLNNDPNQWIILAHLLKARYYNHLSEVDPQGSATSALNEINAAIAAGWDTSMNFEMQYEGNTDHFNNLNLMQVDAIINASFRFLDMLKTTNDPRLFAYFYPLKVNVTADPDQLSDGGKQILNYRPDLSGKDTTVLDVIGEHIGDPTTLSEYGSSVGLVYSEKDAPMPIILAAEVKFIEAEAALRAGNSARAESAFEEAVQAHLDLVIPRLKSRLNSFKSRNLADVAITSNVDAILAGIDTQIADYIANYGSASGATITLEEIMTQKYKAMFLQGIESWTDLRRHNFAYPSSYFTSPIASGDFATRLPYPISEKQRNRAEIPDDDLFLKLWWDK
ncbi:SusD/RagB family nutrient-binding outer membrane lipoprotein [Fulvivirgaceae bacterium BMA10]|uniref:SusD/RagB family nutrient-binding outer membrane lipoprotein n=1 Tax=Splendidivirga corallicola TaxID=3051826 RepID=A0ABT8KI81_9BACT|nr:SusD/RagB family nutrient-binding outer membrane lipoprotein [Fulvivirgaceae bacterium BMA10]